jgi:hypothetical protein
MLEEVAIQRDVVLRRRDTRVPAVFFWERKLEIVFVIVGNRPRASARSGIRNQLDARIRGPESLHLCLPALGLLSHSVWQKTEIRRPGKCNNKSDVDEMRLISNMMFSP